MWLANQRHTFNFQQKPPSLIRAHLVLKTPPPSTRLYMTCNLMSSYEDGSNLHVFEYLGKSTDFWQAIDQGVHRHVVQRAPYTG